MSDILQWASEFSLVFWIFLTISNMFTLRQIIFDMLIGSFAGKYNTCRKKAIAIRKQQKLLSIITQKYIEEHVSDKLKRPYETYMMIKVLYEIWITCSLICMITMMTGELNNEQLIKGVIVFFSLLIWLLMFIPYNPITRSARRIDFKFPNR